MPKQIADKLWEISRVITLTGDEYMAFNPNTGVIIEALNMDTLLDKLKQYEYERRTP